MNRVLPCRGRPRSGMAAAVVVVVLLLMSAMLVYQVQGVLRERRQLRRERYRIQAELLAEAGLARAALQLNNDPEYREENWRVSAEALPSDGEAEVAIAVTPEHVCTVVTLYPLSEDTKSQVDTVRVTRSRKLVP
ncbi:MAG: hypothetical protein KDA96_16115 [Planctomycetaceae bacterium]|nr:hypothetical protein [Planctomycetaceae bacterium]